jgi:5-methylcytosine-specific restriction endonuclease McrA
MDNTCIDNLFSSEIDLLIKYSDYRIIPFDIAVFRELSLGRKLRRIKQVVNMGAKCSYCPRRGDYIFVGKPRTNKSLPSIMIVSADLVAMTVDHIIPIAREGKDSSDNRQVLCELCNLEKADKVPPRARQVLIGK